MRIVALLLQYMYRLISVGIHMIKTNGLTIVLSL